MAQHPVLTHLAQKMNLILTVKCIRIVSSSENNLHFLLGIMTLNRHFKRLIVEYVWALSAVIKVWLAPDELTHAHITIEGFPLAHAQLQIPNARSGSISSWGQPAQSTALFAVFYSIFFLN